ncbi:MAG: hypothetical protein ABIG44_11305 [Planctomycetota bacterium]
MLRMVVSSVVVVMSLAWFAGCRSEQTSPVEARPAENVRVVEEHWPNGVLRVRREVVSAVDGTLINHGLYTQWYQDGTKEYESTYVQGQLHGVETAWHMNSRKRTEQHYEHGERHGPRYVWDEEGNKRGEEHYWQDKPDGTWTVWKKDGQIKWQSRFDRGKPLP